jgi:tetratricopeptide (TPR) repeat protein
VNLTARLMAKAEPGQVFVTESVLSASRTKFAVTPVEPFMVKGKARPVAASLLGEVTSDDVTEQDETDTPLVGREVELREMARLLAAARAGRGHLLEIVGEAGIGKSRLVQELRNRAHGLTIRSALCEEFEANTPYFAFRHVLGALLGIPPDMAGPAAGRQLAAIATDRAANVLPWLPLVAEVIGADIRNTPQVRDLDPKFRPDRVAAATIELLAAVVASPTLVVVEDTHWMDEPSARLLDRLSRVVHELPLLVCTTRRELQTGYAAQDSTHSTTLRPQPLDESVAASFVVALTDDAPLAPHDIEALARRSGGNPLFLRELVAAARTAGSLDELPDSIDAVIVSRIDRLAAEDRALLRRLSVLGSTFEVRLANELLGSDLTPGSALWRRLSGFLTADVPGVARFQHALIRDAAYSGLPYRVRQELHQQVGTTIERSAGADAAEQAGVLSLHFFNAGQYSKAWKYSRLAAERAQAIYANVEAAEFFSRATTAARKASGVTDTDLAATHEAYGDVNRRLGEYGAAIDAYAAARKLVAHPVDEARLLLKTGRVREVAGRYADALRWLDRAAKALGDAGDTSTVGQRAQVAVAFAAVKYAQAKPRDVITRAQQAIVDATSSGDRDALAHAYYLLDAAHVALGDLLSATHSADALALYEELGDLWGQGQVLNNLGCYAYWRGEWDEALRLYERGRAARERIGDAVNAAYGTLNIAEILSDQGRLEEAEPLLRQTLRIWRAANDRVGVTNALAHLGRVLYRGGRYDQALEMLTEARELSTTVGRYGDAVELGGRIAECHLLAGDANRALDMATETIGQMRTVGGAAVHAPLLHRVRGQALAVLGRRGEAQTSLQESLDAARRRGADYEVALTLRPLAALAQAAGTSPGELLDESALILDRLGVVRVFEPASLVASSDTVSALVPTQSGAERPQPMEPTP